MNEFLLRRQEFLFQLESGETVEDDFQEFLEQEAQAIESSNNIIALK